jgi:hypothetical protein
MPAMERRTFKYSFTEDGIDVYLSNTYILRLLMQNTSATSQRFIRSDTNVYEIVESVIKSNVNWFRSLLYDRPISEGEINCAVEVMTKEITHQITL